MKGKTKVILGILPLALCFCLAACGGGNGGETGGGETHTHEWVWKSDEAEHWELCEEDNTEREGSRAPHFDGDGDSKCDTCNRDMEREILVTFDANGGAFSGGEESKTVPADGDGKVTFSEIPVLDPMHFAGWSKTDENDADTVLSLGAQTFESNVTLYAVWEEAYSEGLHFSGVSDGTATTGYSVSVGTAEGDIVIPSVYKKLPVVAIDSYGFEQSGITSVSIPASVKKIGEYAFYLCEELESVAFAEGSELETMDESAFEECIALRSIQIPAGLSALSAYTFYDCISLENVTFEAGSELSSIGRSVFYYCRSLAEANLPSGVRTVGQNAYAGCTGLNAVRVEDLTSWFGIEFYYTSPGSDPLRYASEFYVGDELQTDLAVPDGVTRLRSMEFYEFKGFGTITLPDSLTEIGDDAFYQCPSKIVWAGTPTIATIGQKAFDSYRGNEIEIPASVRTIKTRAFNSSSLISVTIPAGVQTIEDNAFDGCKRLIEVFNLSQVEVSRGDSTGLYSSTVKSYVTGSGASKIQTSGNYRFYDDGTAAVLVKYTGNEPSPALPATYNGKSYNIGYGAFSGNLDLVSVKIPNGVAEIAREAFSGCRNLTSVTIPATVKTFGDDAFSECFSLAEVHNLTGYPYTPGDVDHGMVAKYAKRVYTDDSATGNVRTSGNYTFYVDGEKVYLLNYRGEETALTLPSNIDGMHYAIGDFVFQNCDKLLSVSLPEGVTSIGNYAFKSCYRLREVNIPDSVQSIGYNAFENCESLTDITLGEGVKEIPSSLFAYCYSLRNVTIRGSVTSIGSYAFSGCYYLASFPFAGSMTSIGSYAFKSCAFTTLTLPEGVEQIGSSAFADCSSLTEVVFPSSLVSIGSYVFQRDSKLSGVTFRNDGWKVSRSSSMTSPVEVATDSAYTNSQNFLKTYCDYYWKREV